MNEQARQLAKPYLKKEWYSKYGESVQEDHYFFTPEDLDEFALLIIQECIKTVDILPNGYKDYRNTIENEFREDCINTMKKHFGIE
jgi:hypothetical protein